MNNLVILTGPTAVGKTALSVKLAQLIDGEIISADCMQVYKYMDIGSAKVSEKEMCGVRHHLIDCIDPSEDFNVVKFKEMAINAINDIYSRGKMPIICGGTGFYIQALLYDIEFTKTEDDHKHRATLNDFADKYGNQALWDKLKEVDEESAELIPANNRQRVIRAIEYYYETGQKISEHNKQQRQRPAAYNYCYFVLNDNRQKLYERIDKRVDLMIEAGLLEEVKNLLDKGYTREMTSMAGIGYRELIDYYNGIYDLESAIDLIKENSRHYAKRQLTWFRRERDVIWLDRQELLSDEIILETIKDKLIERGI